MSRTRVHFEQSTPDPQSLDRSGDFGPYERFSAAEGSAYADDQVLAFVSKLGDWFCCDDGRHWAVMVVTGAGWRRTRSPPAALLALAPALPGIISLWQHASLLYLGRAQSIRRVEALLGGAEGIDPAQVTDVMWENHPNPPAREAELHAEYVQASRSLLRTYGRWHGSRVRSSRLIERSLQTVARAQELLERARYVCLALGVAA